MNEKQYAFDRNSPLYNVYRAFLIVYDFLSFPYASHHIPTSWNNIKGPLLLHRQI